MKAGSMQERVQMQASQLGRLQYGPSLAAMRLLHEYPQFLPKRFQIHVHKEL